MVWNEEKNSGLVKLSRETACARSALVEHRGFELSKSLFVIFSKTRKWLYFAGF